MINNKIKPIAIYLPQFHPIAENDEWWGKGFTEWTNVTKATPRFKDHYQPHLPADLGFYDLRLEEARLAQEALAKSYGIYGFCYYHYWFNGKRVLNEPLDRKILNKKEDLPFFMCWANENWTRTWDGGDNKILLKQDYSSEDDRKHIIHLISYFHDERYIKVNGKPVFIIYRPKFFPNIEETISIWREEVKKAGFEDLYLGFSQNAEHQYEPTTKGFDFAFEFQPDFNNVPQKKELFILKAVAKFHQIKRRILRKLGFKVVAKSKVLDKDLVYDYEAFAKLQIDKQFTKNVYPGITPMWDNAARRRKKAFILNNSTPQKFQVWLQHICSKYPWSQMPENFLFINAWNEWAEGNHLEPCQKWKSQYLEIIKKVIN